ncbi:MAG: dihydrofolate reductase [Xanthomonadales bacterium]|nr:dihydrofolate reductase [Xanthomonadales bacterium]
MAAEQPSEARITLVAAMGRNRAIGMAGEMPWHLPGELRHFKRITMGKPIIMGRKTWAAIGRALPGRQNVVVTRNPAFEAPGCDVAASLAEALEIACGPELVIIGGGELYVQALPLASRMVLTLVDCEPEADTWFPQWRAEDWEEVDRRDEPADEHNEYAYRVIDLLRKIRCG